MCSLLVFAVQHARVGGGERFREDLGLFHPHVALRQQNGGPIERGGSIEFGKRHEHGVERWRRWRIVIRCGRHWFLDTHTHTQVQIYFENKNLPEHTQKTTEQEFVNFMNEFLVAIPYYYYYWQAVAWLYVFL